MRSARSSVPISIFPIGLLRKSYIGFIRETLCKNTGFWPKLASENEFHFCDGWVSGPLLLRFRHVLDMFRHPSEQISELDRDFSDTDNPSRTKLPNLPNPHIAGAIWGFCVFPDLS